MPYNCTFDTNTSLRPESVRFELATAALSYSVKLDTTSGKPEIYTELISSIAFVSPSDAKTRHRPRVKSPAQIFSALIRSLQQKRRLLLSSLLNKYHNSDRTHLP